MRSSIRAADAIISFFLLQTSHFPGGQKFLLKLGHHFGYTKLHAKLSWGTGW